MKTNDWLPGMTHSCRVSTRSLFNRLGFLILTSLLLIRLSAGAQTALVRETFEGAFPGTWSVGNTNPALAVHWVDVASNFGGETTHGGSWMGYCAGTTYGGTSTLALYTNRMGSFMATNVNLAGIAGATLSFWYKIPSIEGGWDFLRVYASGTNIWQTSTVQADWAEMRLSLNDFIGGTRDLRFQFDTDVSVYYEGAYLDDILLEASTLPFIDRLTSVALDNYSGYVLNADSTCLRNRIAVKSVLSLKNFTGVNTNHSVKMLYKLVNMRTSQAHPIYDITGVTNLDYSFQTNLVIPMAPAQALLFTNTVGLRPATRLSPYDTYAVLCQFFTNNVMVNMMVSDPPTNFYHFTNTVSGDSSVNTLAKMTDLQWSRTWAVGSAAGQESFIANAACQVTRYDDPLQPSTAASVPVLIQYELRDGLNRSIPLLRSNSVAYVPVSNHDTSSPCPNPSQSSTYIPLHIVPVTNLNSVTQVYYVSATVYHTNNPISGERIAGNTWNSPTNRLLHFSGQLFFGDTETIIDYLSSPPSYSGPGTGTAQVSLNNVAGHLRNAPSHTFSAVGPLGVSLYPDGIARIYSGLTTLTPPAVPDEGVERGIKFVRGTVTLSAGGARADAITLILPQGFGWTGSFTDSVLFSRIAFTNMTLTPYLAPAYSTLEFKPGVPLRSNEETKPLWFFSNSLIWDINLGKIIVPVTGCQFVQGLAYETLNVVSNRLFDGPGMSRRTANDRYFEFVKEVQDGMIQIGTGPVGEACIEGALNFGSGSFKSHFPYGVEVAWDDGGYMRLQTGSIEGALSNTLQMAVSYKEDCPGCTSGSMPLQVATVFRPTNKTLQFTPDGGLLGDGAFAGNRDLTWGWINSLGQFAHRVKAIDYGAFHMPGTCLTAENNPAEPEWGPSVLLLTGIEANNPKWIERPFTPEYAEGLADYAGFNFRCLKDNLFWAESTIGGQPGINYPLAARSKYYVRRSGVAGIHQAASFPSTLQLMGYEFSFKNYSLAFLDGLNTDSRTLATIYIPSPAKFEQAMDNLTFNCLGMPKAAGVPGSDGYKYMDYWRADFQTRSIQFKTGSECNPSDGRLVLGVQAHASHVETPLYGFLGFNPNGNLVTYSDGIPGVDSRLKAPNNISVAGPDGSAYDLTVVDDVYYNNPSFSGDQNGWINIPGRLRVPFFEAVKVHLQTSCRTNSSASSNAPIYLSGGWPKPGSGKPEDGWLEGGVSFFDSATYFDPQNQGRPLDVSVALYRNNTATKYHPRAQKLWANLIDFDYPLLWNTSRRTFQSFRSVKTDLSVVAAEHEITYLDPQRTSIDFGLQYNGLPKISVANMLTDAVAPEKGVAAALKAVSGPIFEALSGGTEKLNQTLDPTLEPLVHGIFLRMMGPVVTNFCSQLRTEWNAMPASARMGFLSNVSSNSSRYFLGKNLPAENLNHKLNNIASISAAQNNLLAELESRLKEATNAIGAASDGMLAKNGGNYDLLPAYVKNLVGQIAPQYESAFELSLLNATLKKSEAAFDQIRSSLQTTRSGLTEQIALIATEIASQIATGINEAEMTTVCMGVSNSTYAVFAKLDYKVDDPFKHFKPGELEGQVLAHVEQGFCGSGTAGHIKSVIKQRLYDHQAALNEQLDNIFQEFNNCIRGIVGQSLAALDNSMEGMLGDLGGIAAAGRINGHALIVGDSLNTLRLDGHFEWKAPDPMQFDGFLQIKEMCSDSPPAGCGSPGETTTEVTLGATKVPLSWLLASDAKANVLTKFTLEGGHPVNLAGSMEIDGSLHFEGFDLHSLAATVAFGKYENYLGIRGGMKFSGHDFAGAAFFGRTCTLDPLKLVDPDVAAVVGNPPFTGGYVYGEGWIPISQDVLGVPPSCMFVISAGVGSGAFFFAEGPTFGGKMMQGISGEALCLVGISGHIKMTGAVQGGAQGSAADKLAFHGSGHFEAEIGSCPFCWTWSKNVGLDYRNRRWYINY